jgi:hypothetical protein
LNTRYFYESFADTDDLLGAVYDRVNARANPVLAARRTATQDLLRESVLTEGWRLHPGSDPVAAQVGAAMYTGAMAELAQQWLAGNLGGDLDTVVDYAVQTVLR